MEPLLEQEAEISDKIDRTKREMGERQRKIDEFVQRINKVEDAIYADLSRKVRSL